MANVLVIDDSEDVHELLSVRLTPENVTLHRALDPEEGLALARTLHPDLILLDVDMPNMTGFEVCARLKGDPVTAAIPVIFLTGASEVHTKVQGFDLGAVDYVTKPFQPAELRARVRAALRAKRYLDLLATRAHIDGLTGAWNRTYFGQRMSEEVAAVQRYGRGVSLVILDLDHFKTLNDTYGHPFGDQVLQRVGELLTAVLRTVDAPCRFGGEEFAIILTQTDLTGAVRAAERIREELIGLSFYAKNGVVKVTASFGVTCSSLFSGPRTASVERLVQSAADALYEAKREGRDRVCAATSIAE
jgi:diguanylate cyclase (GGDEF)-like protein